LQKFKAQIDSAPFLWQPNTTFALQEQQKSYFMNLFRMPAIAQVDTAVKFEQTRRPAVTFTDDVEMEEE